MSAAPTSSRSRADSRRRRWRYGLFRAGYVAYRTLGHEGVLGHARIALAVGLALSVALIVWGPQYGMTVPACLSPLWAAAVYVCLIAIVKFTRVWREYPDLRWAMRTRRMQSLLRGGVLVARHHRMGFLRVTLPYYAIIGGGIILMSRLVPRHRQWTKIAELLSIAAITILAIVVRAWSKSWHDRIAPRDLDHRCPRCGYDLSNSPVRCPECGLRRMNPRGIRRRRLSA